MNEFGDGTIRIEPWKRPWRVGPTDDFMHAIGQVSANYAAVEWLIHEIFAVSLDDPALAPMLVHNLSINTGYEPDFIVARLKDDRFHRGAANHATDAITRFKRIKQMRHTLTHWMGAIDPASQLAVFSNVIKRKPSGETSEESYTLAQVRDYAHELIVIVRDLTEALSVLQLPKDEAAAFLRALDKQASSLETSPQSQRLRHLLARTE